MTDSSKCPAKDFLNSQLFVTRFDVDDDKGDKRYNDELVKCAEYSEFSIAVNGVWSARIKNGGCVSSYERIGYHAYSYDLLQAALDSDCEFYVYRIEDDGRTVKHDLRLMQAEAWADYVRWELHYNDLARQLAIATEELQTLSHAQPTKTVQLT